MICYLIFLAISCAGVFGEKHYPGSKNEINCVSTVDIEQDKNATDQKSLRSKTELYSNIPIPIE